MQHECFSCHYKWYFIRNSQKKAEISFDVYLKTTKRLKKFFCAFQEWTHAKDDLTKLRTYIDFNPFDTELESVQQRAWLMHWALFVYFNYPKGRDEIVEMYLNQQPYLNTIQVIL